MTCIVYAIVDLSSSAGYWPGRGLTEVPPGVGGAPIRLIGHGGIAAAISTIDAVDATPSVARAMAYASVIESLHACRTVLPMRYGCLLAEESEVLDLLQTRGAQYRAVLGELAGCAEMGVRVLNGEGAGAAARDAQAPIDVPPGLPGTAYLALKRRFYGDDRHPTKEVADALERIRAALDGLFVRCKVELPSARPSRSPSTFCVPLPALHLLVRREAVGRFREGFRRVERMETARLLMSGPWPPYNFSVPGEGDGNGRI